MRRILLLSALLASSLSAQITRINFGFPAQLKEFLELTDTQVTALNQLNDRLTDYEGSKLERSAIVQFEINQENARPTIDPAALGVRYRELELIRRDVESERSRTRAESQAVLTAAQKTKLTTLEQALRLQSTACEAVNRHLIQAPQLRFIPELSSIAQFLLGGALASSAPCPTNPLSSLAIPRLP